jgi:hypothetical protein
MRVLPLDMLCSHLHNRHNRHEQQPSNTSGLDSSVMGGWESLTLGWTCFWFYFCSKVYDCCWVVYSRYTLLISLKILYDCASVYILMTRMASVMKNICSGNFIVSVLLHEDDCPLRCAV